MTTTANRIRGRAIKSDTISLVNNRGDGSICRPLTLVAAAIAVILVACSSGGSTAGSGDGNPSISVAETTAAGAPTLAQVGQASLAPCGKAGLDEPMQFQSGSASYDDGSGFRLHAEILSVKQVEDGPNAVVIARCEFVGASVTNSTWLGIVSREGEDLKVHGQPVEIDTTVRAEMLGDDVRVESQEFAPTDGRCCPSATDLDTYRPNERGVEHLSPTFRTYDDAVVGEAHQAGIFCDELLGVTDEQWSSLVSGIDYLSVGRGAAGGIVVTRMIDPPDVTIVDRVEWVDGKFETTIEIATDTAAVLFTDDDGEKVCAAPSGEGD